MNKPWDFRAPRWEIPNLWQFCSFFIQPSNPRLYVASSVRQENTFTMWADDGDSPNPKSLRACIAQNCISWLGPRTAPKSPMRQDVCPEVWTPILMPRRTNCKYWLTLQCEYFVDDIRPKFKSWKNTEKKMVRRSFPSIFWLKNDARVLSLSPRRWWTCTCTQSHRKRSAVMFRTCTHMQ